jgi:hypothetical protein
MKKQNLPSEAHQFSIYTEYIKPVKRKKGNRGQRTPYIS